MEQVLQSPYIFSLLPLSLLLLTFILIRLITKPRRSPLALPIIGHLHLLHSPLHLSLHRLSSLHGPVTPLLLGSTPAILISSASAAKHLIKSHDHALSDRPTSAAARHFAYQSSGFAFAPHGPYWRFMKKLCVSQLLSPRTVDSLAHIRRREILSMLRILAAKAEAGELADLSEELIRMSTSVIAGMMAGAGPAGGAGDWETTRKAVKGVAECMGAVNLGDFVGFFGVFDVQGFGRRIREVRDGFDVVMDRMIEEKEGKRRRKRLEGGDEGDYKDLLDMLLDAAEDKEMEIRLTRENIKGFILV